MSKFLTPALPILAAIALASCTEVQRPGEEQVGTSSQANFSAEDKRIASRLSLGTGQLARASTEGKALLCELGLEAIRARIQTSGALSADQLDAFEQAREHYHRLAVQGYGTAEKLAEARSRAEIDYPRTGDRARLAVTCLRDLAES